VLDSNDVRTSIRTQIGDDNPESETYTDLQLNNFIGSAISRLNRRIISPTLPFHFASGIFYPSQPNDVQGDLVILQASCMILTRQYYQLAQRSVRVKQDENEVDTSVFANSFKDLVTGTNGVCSQLDKAVALYLNTVGSAATASGQNIWSGNSELYADVDHNGQMSERIYRPRAHGHLRRSGRGGDSGPTDDIYRVSEW
jgi:hypothetical protein